MTFTQKMFSFEGRLHRQDFWISTLILWAVRWSLLIAVIVIAVVPMIAAGAFNEGKDLTDAQKAAMVGGMFVPIGLILLVQLAMIWPELAINVKRFHDRDQSGWLAAIFLVNAVPLLNYLTTIPTFIFWLVDLGILEGTPGPNRYGESPKPEFGPEQVFA